MLSRTADHLFWMSRYMERAENTARLLDAHFQTSLLPERTASASAGWHAVLGISELNPAYAQRYGEVEGAQVLKFMVRDAQNPSSIAACLSAARENARAVRSALTTELWETTNQTWLEFNRLVGDGALERDPSSLLEWVKFRSHLSRGVTLGTMLHDEALNFIRLGTFLERADNTARLLDVKFHQNGDHLTPAPPPPSAQAKNDHPELENLGETDFYHWSALLRSLSAFEIYRKVYSSVILPEKVAELLILRDDMPRSLAACTQEMVRDLSMVAHAHSGETLRQLGRLNSELKYGRIDEILKEGLHPYLIRFLHQINLVGARISQDFLVAT